MQVKLMISLLATLFPIIYDKLVYGMNLPVLNDQSYWFQIMY